METTRRLKLLHGHLILPFDWMQELFPQQSYIEIVFYPANKTLLIASTHDNVFKSIHKSHAQFVKDKNLQGDKTISLHEIIIDNDLNIADEVEAKADFQMNIIQVFLSS
jgi:hypothetical protein